MKPRKCERCVYLERVKLIYMEKNFHVVTRTGRTMAQYRCKKHNETYYLVRESCQGPYQEEEKI